MVSKICTKSGHRSSDFVGCCCNDRKLHLLEEPKLLNLDISNRHYFAKVILTRTVEPPTTTSSTCVAVDSDSESDPDYVPDDEALKND